MVKPVNDAANGRMESAIIADFQDAIGKIMKKFYDRKTNRIFFTPAEAKAH
jgi:hypothetical protein